MVQLLNYNNAAKMLGTIPVNHFADIGKTGWMSLLVMTVATCTFEGFYCAQTKCAFFKTLPGVGEVASYTCAGLALSVMLMSTGCIFHSVSMIGGIYSSLERRKGQQKINVSGLIESNAYNHYSNLTAWHANFKGAGLDTSLVFDENAVYYEEDGCLYGINATSQIVSPSGECMIIQHGMDASRMFKINDSGKHGHLTDIILNNDGYYEWCHANMTIASTYEMVDSISGEKSDETASFRNEWSEVAICDKYK